MLITSPTYLPTSPAFSSIFTDLRACISRVPTFCTTILACISSVRRSIRLAYSSSAGATKTLASKSCILIHTTILDSVVGLLANFSNRLDHAAQFNTPPEHLSGTTGSYRLLLAAFDSTVWRFQHPGGLPVHEPLRNIPKRARFVRLNTDPGSRAFLEETMNEGAYAVWALATVMEAGYGSEITANIWIVKTG